jgi:hypothetical protein
MRWVNGHWWLHAFYAILLMLIARVFFEHPYARDERDDDMFDRGQLKLGDLCRHRPVGDFVAQPPAAVPNVRFLRRPRRSR